MRKIVLILVILIMIALLFLPIFDATTYNYDNAESELQETVEKYAQNNPQKSVSIMSYRQTTGGTHWTIRLSTDDSLVGEVIPLWMISPLLLRDEIDYSNAFIYKKLIVITDKKEVIHKFNYDGEKVSVILPWKIIVATPKTEKRIIGETYRVYNLSLIGIIWFYVKIGLYMGVVVLIIKVYRNARKKGKTQGDGSVVLTDKVK